MTLKSSPASEFSILQGTHVATTRFLASSLGRSIMSRNRVISQDNHVIEPVDLWTSRAESKYAWRVPQVEDLGEQGDQRKMPWA